MLIISKPLDQVNSKTANVTGASDEIGQPIILQLVLNVLDYCR